MHREPTAGGGRARAWLVILLACAACGEPPAPALDRLGPVRLQMKDTELRASLRNAGVEVRCGNAGRLVHCAWQHPTGAAELRYWTREGRVVLAGRRTLRPAGGESVSALYKAEMQRLPGAAAWSTHETYGEVQLEDAEGLQWVDTGRIERGIQCVDTGDGRYLCIEGIAWLPGASHDELDGTFDDKLRPVPCTSWPRRLLGSC